MEKNKRWEKIYSIFLKVRYSTPHPHRLTLRRGNEDAFYKNTQYWNAKKTVRFLIRGLSLWRPKHNVRRSCYNSLGALASPQSC